MKTTIKLSILALLVVFMTTSCSKNRLTGHGPTVSQDFSIANFEKIDLNIPADVNYTSGADYSVEVNAQQNVLDRMRVEKVGNVLFLSFKNNTNLLRHEKITINVTSPVFEGADVSGSGCIYVRGAYTADIVTTDISGSGKIDIADLTMTKLNADISGSGKISIASGSADEIKTDISGSGKIELEQVEAKVVDTKTTGSGRTNVWATESLDVEITGSGNVYYKGTPTVDVDITGSGNLRQL